MDNYFVGSVADFISQGKLNITKNKKSCLVQNEVSKKQEKQKPSKKNLTQNKDCNVGSKIGKSFGEDFQNQDSIKTKRLKFSKNLVPENTRQNEQTGKKSLLKSTKQEGLVSEENPKFKNTKKFFTETVNTKHVVEPLKSKNKKKDILDLNYIPSDSEEDINENSDGQNGNNKKKQFDCSQFTENTIFVGNIPIHFDKQKVCKMFSKFGKIKSARIRCVPIADINMSKKVAAVKKKFNPNRNSLVAYVKYVSEKSAHAALEANGFVVDGHHLRVDMAQENKNRDNNKAVFVGGLPFDVEDDELWKFFENCGKINNVRVIRDSQTSMGKGFGYVNFNSAASVELALQLDGQQLKKRTINVKRCVKARNKNKQNAFGKSVSLKITKSLLSKKGKKLKNLKSKDKEMSKPQLTNNFQGKKANVKEKKKKKLSKAELRKRKVIKILGAPSS